MASCNSCGLPSRPIVTPDLILNDSTLGSLPDHQLLLGPLLAISSSLQYPPSPIANGEKDIAPMTSCSCELDFEAPLPQHNAVRSQEDANEKSELSQPPAADSHDEQCFLHVHAVSETDSGVDVRTFSDSDSTQTISDRESQEIIGCEGENGARFYSNEPAEDLVQSVVDNCDCGGCVTDISTPREEQQATITPFTNNDREEPRLTSITTSPCNCPDCVALRARADEEAQANFTRQFDPKPTSMSPCNCPDCVARRAREETNKKEESEDRGSDRSTARGPCTCNKCVARRERERIAQRDNLPKESCYCEECVKRRRLERTFREAEAAEKRVKLDPMRERLRRIQKERAKKREEMQQQQLMRTKEPLSNNEAHVVDIDELVKSIESGNSKQNKKRSKKKTTTSAAPEDLAASPKEDDHHGHVDVVGHCMPSSVCNDQMHKHSASNPGPINCSAHSCHVAPASPSKPTSNSQRTKKPKPHKHKAKKLHVIGTSETEAEENEMDDDDPIVEQFKIFCEKCILERPVERVKLPLNFV